MDPELRSPISGDPDQHVKDAALALCRNRAVYFFRESDEKAILAAIEERGLLSGLVEQVVLLLNDKDGNVRLGAAELLGTIPPPAYKEEVIGPLERHLQDTFVRDYVYGGAQGDEEDMRTVAECARRSIERLQAVS